MKIGSPYNERRSFMAHVVHMFDRESGRAGFVSGDLSRMKSDLIKTDAPLKLLTVFDDGYKPCDGDSGIQDRIFRVAQEVVDGRFDMNETAEAFREFQGSSICLVRGRGDRLNVLIYPKQHVVAVVPSLARNVVKRTMETFSFGTA
jgi:hypothetical protein